MVCEGALLSSGNLLFGDNKKVSLSENANLARDGQGQMLYGASLKNIVVFYEQRNQNDCKKLKYRNIKSGRKNNNQVGNIKYFKVNFKII